MIPVKGVAGQRIAVLGLGRSGLAAARALRDGGAEVVAWDDNPAARAAAEGEGFATADLTRAGAFDQIAALIVSPGIPHLYPAPNPVVMAALRAGVPVDNDIGLFFRSFATEEWHSFDVLPQVVAVTGSNGKSTTSALVHHILKHAGRPTQLAGNIGRGVLDIEPAIDGEVVVLELSSYQTDLARNLTPDVAVFTNLSPDHLDRHAGMGGYFAAKRRLFAEGGPDRAVIGVDEPEGRFLAGQLSEGAADDRVIPARKRFGKGADIIVRHRNAFGPRQTHPFVRAGMDQRVVEDRIAALGQCRQQHAIGAVAIGKEQRAFAAEKNRGLAFEQFMFFVIAAQQSGPARAHGNPARQRIGDRAPEARIASITLSITI